MAKSRYTENRLDAALAEGVRRKVPVWLLLDAPWSEDARAWKSEVWNDPHVVELRKQFVTCELNRDTAGETDQAAQFLLQSMAARSGWPLNLFLDPYSGAPIMGTPSLEAKPLVDLLGQMLQAWKIDSDSLRGLAQTQRAALAPSDPLGLSHGKLEGEDVDAWLDDKMMGAWLTPLEQSLDFESGFVGQGEVFHYPSVYKCLLASPELAKWAELALTRLGSSHACDVIGGGFFRSAGRDPDKFVATEKLAVENAELLEAYLSYRNPAHSTFLIQVATEITAFLVSDLMQNNSVAAGLSGSAGYYRLSPADLIEAVDGRNRQPAQMFFGIENGGRVPYLPTELTLLATFLKWAP
ncbi:MAG: DUF255 domain-containing protein, partial [Bdellovibrionales bacterium]|nr:DUF255 domain-containing protein [Bdellovibrionales bacterium]